MTLARPFKFPEPHFHHLSKGAQSRLKERMRWLVARILSLTAIAFAASLSKAKSPLWSIAIPVQDDAWTQQVAAVEAL